MAETENYHLSQTEDNQETFLDWRTKLNSVDNANNDMKKIDTALSGKADGMSYNSATGQLQLTTLGGVPLGDPVSVASTAKLVTIQLTPSWSGAGPYTQNITIQGATARSKIDLQPSAAVLSQLATDKVQSLWIENNEGSIYAVAYGAAPTAAMTVQATMSEVVE